VFCNVVAVIVSRTRKADQLPAHHVAIAAVNGVSEESLDGVGKNHFKESFSVTIRILDLAILRGSAGLAMLVVQLERSHARDGAGKSVGRTLAKIHFGQKFICLVDEDIDIRDQETLNWALSSRVDPECDIEIVQGVSTYQYDPSILARTETQGHQLSAPPYRSSIAIVDATLKCTVPEVSLPGRSLMRTVLANWEKTGLPPIAPRKRIERLLDVHSESGLDFSLPIRNKTSKRPSTNS